MISTPNIGKIYDTLFFCIRYYNEKAVRETTTSKLASNSFMENCYNELKMRTPALPPLLAPIFLYRNQTPTAITDFFTEQINFERDTIDTFLKKLTVNSDILYSKIVDSIFANEINIDQRTIAPLIAPATYIDTLSNSNYSDSLKLQISLLFGNYNYAISLLIEQLRLIYNHIDALHQKYFDKLSFEIEQIQSSRNAQLYKHLFSLNISSDCEPSFVAVSLLNQHLTKIVAKDGYLELLLGIEHEEELLLQFDEQNIDLRELLIGIGNDTRLSILQILMEKEELTASSISKITQLPPTTVLRHIEILYNCGAVFISKRSGLQIFYRINYNFLIRAINLINVKLGGKINDETRNPNQES